MTELLVLGGERVAAADGGTSEVVEPSTGTSAWEVSQASPEDARRAVLRRRCPDADGRMWREVSLQRPGLGVVARDACAEASERGGAG